MTTYLVTPNDTLFFRGGEPMEAGESHFQTSVFPPSPETLIGAVRTSVIAYASDGDFEGYKNGKYAETAWFKEIGLKEPPPTFKFTGPFLKMRDDILLTPPSNLFVDKAGHFTLASPRRFDDVVHSPGIPSIMWLPESGGSKSKEWKPVEGYITIKGMDKYLKGAINALDQTTDFVKTGVGDDSPAAKILVMTEARTGIALKKNGLRTVETSRLYMTSHKRFGEGTGMIFLLEGVSTMPDASIIRLGGENRTAYCEKVEDVILPSFGENVEFLVTTMPIKVEKVTGGIPVTEFLDEDMNVILSGGTSSRLISYSVTRPLQFGGWDLAAQKSKEMIQYVPAGSVFYFEKCSIKGHNNKYLLGGKDVR